MQNENANFKVKMNFHILIFFDIKFATKTIIIMNCAEVAPFFKRKMLIRVYDIYLYVYMRCCGT